MFGKKKNDVIEVHMNEPINHNIKVTKNDINFNIVLKETREVKEYEPDNFVWFLHVELPKSKKYRLCAYGIKKFHGYTVCQEDAFIYLNNLSYEFYKMIKDL